MRWLPLLALTGCWSLHTPTMKRAKELEAAGQTEEAERTWYGAMSDEVTLSEWRRAQERYCALMSARLEPQVRALSPESVSYEEVSALRAELGRCPEGAPLMAEVQHLGELKAAASLAEAKALESEGRLYEAARSALPHVRQLGPEHPDRAWYGALLAAWVAELDARVESLPGGSPVTRAALRTLADQAGASHGADLAAAATPALSVVAGEAQVSADESCAAAPLPERVSGDAAGFGVTMQLRSCQEGTRVEERSVSYSETRYRTETQVVEHTEVTRVTTVTPTYNVSCYESWNTGDTVCTTVGYYNDTEVEEYTETWYEEVEVEVPYEVPMTRQGLFPSRWATAQLDVSVDTPDGQLTKTVSVSARREGREHPTSADRAALASQAPGSGPVQTALVEQALEQGAEAAQAAAKDLRLAALRAQAEDMSAPATATEALLTLYVRGAIMNAEQAAFIARSLGLPEGAFPDALGLALDEDGYAQPPIELATFRLPEINNTVSKGYPPILFGLGYTQAIGPELVGQPTRSARGVTLDLGYGVGWVHRRSRGLGVHLSPGVALSYQRRTSESYAFPPNDYGFPNEEELDTAAGFQLELGALVGYRSRFLGVFAGATPRLDGQMIGFYNARAFSVAPTLRLELKPVERYPILVEAWWGDLQALGEAQVGPRGGQVWFPLGGNTYLHGRAEERYLRTQFKGLTSGDDVDAGLQPLRTLQVGLAVGI